MIKKKETALRRLRSKDCRWDDYKNYSPELQKDPEVCLAAAENDGSVLMFIPEECRTREVCLAAVTGNGGVGTSYIPGEVKTDVTFWTEAVRLESHLISAVPADLLTEEICIDAVKQHAGNLYWVPERLQTPKACRTALENDYRVAVLNIRKSVLLEAMNALEERYAKEQGLSRDGGTPEPARRLVRGQQQRKRPRRGHVKRTQPLYVYEIILKEKQHMIQKI